MFMMVKLTGIFGIILIVIGMSGLLIVRQPLLSEAIPILLGLALTLLSQTAKREIYFKKSMQAAVLLAFLGFLGSGLKVIDGLFIKVSVQTLAVFLMQSILMLVCAVYIGLAVKAHFEARTEK